MDETARLLVSLQLPVAASSPALARSAVKAVSHLLGGAEDDILLAVSELVTNAVRHSGTAADDRIAFRVEDRGDRIRVEVSDGGDGRVDLAPGTPQPGSDHGWGLVMVDEVADRWGIERGDRTTVWLEIVPPRPAVPEPSAGDLVDAAVEALVTVDGSGTVVEWNRMAAEAFGHSRDEALGRRFADLVVAPADVSAPARNLRGRIGEAGDLLDGQPVEMSLVGRGASPLHALVRVTPARRPGYFHVSILDVSDQRRSEEATREMVAMLAYLADASELLASSLDVDRTLRRLARLVVPRHADWCTINLLEEDGSIRRVAAEHADPQRAAELARLLDAHPNEPDSDSGVAYTIRTGEAQLFEVVDDALLAETANDPEYLEITAQLQIRSCVIAPLEARGRVLGSISLVYTEQAKTYNAADRALAEDLGRRAGLAIDNARLYEQRDTIARSLQRSLLPPFLPEIPGFDLAARYEPAGAGNDVGGDFYDAFETSTGRWNLVIGDVEGKGPDAAALIGLARHTLRALAIEHTSPAEMLRLLNQALLADHSQLLCTVALCHLEVEAGRVIVARAGHPAPMLVRRFGAVEMLGKEGTLLGATDTPVIHETAAQVQPGDNVVLFTDGVVGSRALTAEDVADVLSELAGKGAREIADELVMVAERSRPGGPGDDVAILVARRDQD